MIKKSEIAISLLVLTLSFLAEVDAHGYVQTPRSRNWVAAEDGEWWGGSPDLPAKENCPSCANTKNADGYCGIVDGRDYDNPLNAAGEPLVPQAQAVYTEGEIIDMEFVFTANHNGHHQAYACPDFFNPTKECFEQHPLEFIEDISMEAYGTDANAPKDLNYPERGYVNPSASHTRMRFKLPEGVSGDLVLLQWHWITGNSCRSDGYDDYDYPDGWEPSNTGPCPAPLSPIGVGAPEQFWNCVEVEIISSGPTTSNPTPSPTNSPVPTLTMTDPPSLPPGMTALPTPFTTNTPTKAPTVPTPPGNGCCSQTYSDCDATWCGDTEAACQSCGTFYVWLPDGPVSGCIPRWGACTNDVSGCCLPSLCTGDEWYKQCLPDPNAPPPTPPSPTPPSPTPPPVELTFEPTVTPQTLAPFPVGTNNLFSTTNTRTSYEALLELNSITNIVQLANPPIYALISEGGAAGSGDVVSEGQGYAVMIAGVTLASMDPSDPNRADTMNRFYGYYYGWKRMCINSTPVSWCQSEKLCDGGTTACLPGWKHDADLTEVIGAGAAPDGDQDAIVGMIMAVKAVENDNPKPQWYEDVRMWADASSTSFLFHNTKPSKTGNANRILKLGSCWGGWETEGNNPSYHSPGSYRLMEKYQAEFPDEDRDYDMPEFDDAISTETRWKRVISTSYDYMKSSQCDDIGVVPNWAMATENAQGQVVVFPGPFSGSGTPQYEFGSEASRTVWRILLDVAMFPDEAYAEAFNFLNPLHNRLDQGFTGSDWNDDTLIPCDGVDSIFPFWRFNAFIYSPVYSSLVLKAASIDTSTQQSMVDAAGGIVNTIPSGLSYYSRCWSIIGILTLNGDVTKAAKMIYPPSTDPTTSPVSIPTSPPVPTQPPTTPSPTVSQPTPTMSPNSSNAPTTVLQQLSSLIQILMPILNAILAIIDQLNSLLAAFGLN